MCGVITYGKLAVGGGAVHHVNHQERVHSYSQQARRDDVVIVVTLYMRLDG